VPVEALASGTPVIAYKAGGALDYVTPKTGLFFSEQKVDSLVSALQKFDPKNYRQADLTAKANQFSKAIFVQKMANFIKNHS
jgi:glycosyltransferase involved in cell wall biosynthesis